MGADVTHPSILRIIDIVLWRSEEVRLAGTRRVAEAVSTTARYRFEPAVGMLWGGL